MDPFRKMRDLEVVCGPDESSVTFVRELNFGQAIEALKAGKKVKRKAWGGHWQLLNNPYGWQDHAEDRCTSFSFSNGLILATLKDNGGCAPAQAYQADILAEDWEIVRVKPFEGCVTGVNDGVDFGGPIGTPIPQVHGKVKGESMNLKEVVEQLKKCDFEYQAGSLENSVAFIRLEEMANTETNICHVNGELVASISVGDGDVILGNDYKVVSTNERK